MEDVEMNNLSTSSSDEEEDPTEDELRDLLKSGEDDCLLKQVSFASRKLGYLNLLRECRHTLSQKAVQLEDFWIEWIDDEINIIGDNYEIVVNICQQALKDSFFTSVWERYMKFLCSHEDICKFNLYELFDGALKIAGMNLTNGIKLWRIYYAYCISNLSEDVFVKLKLKSMIERQLSIPLAGFSTNELHKLLDQLGEEKDIYMKSYELMTQEVKSRLKFDEILKLATANNMLNVINQYVQFEINLNRNDLAVARFEQAAQICPEMVELWKEYIFQIVYRMQFDPDIIIQVCERATRNCPSSAHLWIEKAKCCERASKSLSDIKSIYNQALNSELPNAQEYKNVWTAFISFLRRNSNFNEKDVDGSIAKEFRESFQSAIDQIFEFFGTEADPECSLEKYWAYAEAKYFNDMNHARAIWRESIFQIGYKDKCSFWEEYLSLEREFGDDKHYRKMLVKAIQSVVDDVDRICSIARNYELINGSLEQFDQMELIIMPRLNSAAKEIKIKRKVNENQMKSKTEVVIPHKQSKLDQKCKLDKDGFGIPTIHLPVTTKQMRNIDINATNVVENIKCAVFLSNLSYDCSEDDIKNFFQEKVADIKSNYIARNYKNMSKGYGHVEFNLEEHAKQALLLDHTNLKGRPMFISEYKSKSDGVKSEKAFKFYIGIEKNKLFIRDLHKSIDSEQLKKIYQKFGHVKDARVVTYKNGNSKGFAYIEFENQSEASAALLQTDNMEIKGQSISVAVSNTPDRKPIQQNRVSNTDRKVHLQMSSDSLPIFPGDATKTNLTNQQFRDMLFNK